MIDGVDQGRAEWVGSNQRGAIQQSNQTESNETSTAEGINGAIQNKNGGDDDGVNYFLGQLTDEPSSSVQQFHCGGTTGK